MSILDDAHHDEQQAYGERDARCGYQQARERFGGTNRVAVFFGWLTTIALTALLGVVAAFAAVVGTIIDPGSDRVGAGGVVGGLTVTVVLFAAYSAGGYVAGRMCRFDGGRQGMGVWLIGLVSTLVAFGVGMAIGREYPVPQRVDLPEVAVPSDLSVLGAFTAAMILALTLLGAMAGGALGQRYHAKVDRVRYP